MDWRGALFHCGEHGERRQPVNIFLTLFGGLLTVILLFLGGVRLGIPPVLRGIIAAGFPLIAYSIASVRYWPGLDVLSLHVATFAVAAFVMVVMAKQQAKSGAKKMHWAPKAFVVYVFILVLLNAGFLYVSTQGIPTNWVHYFLPDPGDKTIRTGFSGVVEHGQDAASPVASELSESNRQQAIGWQAQVLGLDAPRRGANTVYIKVMDGYSLWVHGLDATMAVSRPGGGESQMVAFKEQGNAYEGTLDFDGPGRWIVDMRISKGQAVLHRSWTIQVR